MPTHYAVCDEYNRIIAEPFWDEISPFRTDGNSTNGLLIFNDQNDAIAVLGALDSYYIACGAGARTGYTVRGITITIEH